MELMEMLGGEVPRVFEASSFEGVERAVRLDQAYAEHAHIPGRRLECELWYRITGVTFILEDLQIYDLALAIDHRGFCLGHHRR